MKKFNPMLIIPQLKELWNELADLHKVLDEVDTATDNANQSAQTANEAADFANSQRGWTPIHVFEEDGAQRLVKKLSDYIGGTGDKPTANIGQYVIDGGYTADKSLAENFKGEGAGGEPGGGGDIMVEITHSDLLSLVNNSGLTPGQQYRITDYVATVNTDVYIEGAYDARSNNHAFDIIVTADNVSKLNENARAIRHEGDTYFPLHTKFKEWKLKYTILNDSDRFDWAVSEGKGVIYQLIDEWGNDLSYDFKSIQFQRDGVWVYTFGDYLDASLEIGNCTDNTIKAAKIGEQYYLNNNHFADNCSYNTLGYNCYSNTFGGWCSMNTFGAGCSDNTFGEGCGLNTFGVECSENTFGGWCSMNTFGEVCGYNTFGEGCGMNTFGVECSENTFGEGCGMNTFGHACYSNTFGDEYVNYHLSSLISEIDFTNQLSNFTTPPNYNTIEVIKTPTGAVMQQRISANETESFDAVINT